MTTTSAPSPVRVTLHFVAALAVFGATNTAPAQVVSGDLLVDVAAPAGTRSVQSTSTGDVDGDGFEELALVSSGSAVASGDDLIVHRSLDGRTFEALTTIATGRRLDTVHLVDVDGDGALDLLASVGDVSPFPFGAAGPGGILVHLGVGDGTFGPEIFSLFGGALDECVLGDFDGDGVVDVAAAAQRGLVPVFSGVGDGTFVLAAVLRVTEPSSPSSPQWTELAATDLDGNGVDDLAITSPLESFVTIHLGRPGAGLLPGQRVELRNGALDLAFGDVDGDGRPDLVVTDEVLVVMPGIGDGTLAPPATIADASVRELAVTDVDGDGRDDAVGVAHGGVFVWRSLGGDAFERTAWTGVGPTNTGTAPAVLDVTRDGRLDVVVGSSWSSAPFSGPQGALKVLEGVGGGVFRGWPATSPRVEDVVTADVDADGHVDLVYVLGDPLCEENGSVAVLRGLGRGVFEQERTLAVRLDARSVAAADLDADGVVDLAVLTGGTLKSLTILRGLGDLQYEKHDVVLLNGAQSPERVLLSDLDDDGDLDAVVVARFGHFVAVALNAGDGRFGDATEYPTAQRPFDVAVADVTGDGTLDVVVRTDEACQVLAGTGDGTLATPTTILVDSAGVGLATGDVDRDGDVDVVATRVNGSTSLLLNAGGGLFAPPIMIPASWPGSPLTRDVTLADLDDDGAPELILANELAGTDTPPVFQLAVWAGGGDGTFGTPNGFGLAGLQHTRLLAADVDGDGDRDVVVAGQEGRIDVLFNTTVR